MRKQIYKGLDILTLGNGIERRISGFSLRIPVGFHNYFESDYELNNINFINNYVTEGMVAIDIGAHIGLLSVIIAKKVGESGKVYSFEPTPSTFKLLKKTLSINSVGSRVMPQTYAVSEKKGTTFFYVTDIEAHNSNSLANNNRKEGNEHKIEVPLISVDEFLTDNKIVKIDFLKIDAEGAEYSVLKGAISSIQKHHPKIILALHPESILNFGDSLEKIWDFIKENNYRVIYKSDEISRDFFLCQTDLFDVFLV